MLTSWLMTAPLSMQGVCGGTVWRPGKASEGGREVRSLQ